MRYGSKTASADTKETVLKANPWVSLKVLRSSNPAVDGSVFSHETRCDGKIVAILPYRTRGDGEVEFLLRSEITGPWGDAPQISSITGGHEGRDTRDTAVMEIKEEAGYEVTPDDLIDLGTSFASKSSDTVYNLYSVDLTGKTPGEAKGDGSAAEDVATTVWKRKPESMDPQVHVMLVRLVDEMGWSLKATPTQKGFQGVLEKVAVGALMGMAMKGLGGLMSPVSKMMRSGVGAVGRTTADAGFKAVASPIAGSARYIGRGQGAKGKLTRAGGLAGVGLTAYDVGSTTKKNLAGGIYRPR